MYGCAFFVEEEFFMSFLDLAKKRYSCRKLSAQPVEEEKLQKILEAGNLAPTAHRPQQSAASYLAS